MGAGKYWRVMDYQRHADGWQQMTTREVKERAAGLRRVTSGDGGELWFDEKGVMVLECYPPPVVHLAAPIACDECGTAMPPGSPPLCQACTALPARIIRGPVPDRRNEW